MELAKSVFGSRNPDGYSSKATTGSFLMLYNKVGFIRCQLRLKHGEHISINPNIMHHKN